MGIETAAIGALAPEILAGTAAATTAGTAGAAAGLGAASAAGAGAAAGGAGAVAGSLEAANVVGALGGDALGAFISANQGWGTMTAAESIQGFMGALAESPVIQGMQAASAANQPEAPDPGLHMHPAQEMRGANQTPSLLQQSDLMRQDSSADVQYLTGLGTLGFEDGGRVPTNRLQQMFPNNIFARTRQAQEEAAGLSSRSDGGVTINIGRTGEPYGEPNVERSPGNAPRTQVDGPSMEALAIALKQLISGFQDGGQVRSGSSDVKAGGKIRGPQSKTGRDNQIIKVAGGEGILPKDVMDVPGVAQLVQSLIQTYHTPVK